MAKIQHVCLDEVVGYFDELEDPRSTVNQQHPLVSVVVIAMMAVLAGAAGPTAIARWAAFKEEFLLKTLHLPNGIPRKDVFRRVLSLLKPGAFQACFVNWLGSLRAKAAEALGVDQPIFAVTITKRAWALCIRSVSGQVNLACPWARWLVPRNPMKSRPFRSFYGLWIFKARSSPSMRWVRKKRLPLKSLMAKRTLFWR
jgi:hypothetical protein